MESLGDLLDRVNIVLIRTHDFEFEYRSSITIRIEHDEIFPGRSIDRLTD